jgi:hypothetical protein
MKTARHESSSWRNIQAELLSLLYVSNMSHWATGHGFNMWNVPVHRSVLEMPTFAQEIPSILRTLKIHCRVHNSPPLVPILSHDESSPQPPFLFLWDPFKYHPIYVEVFLLDSFLQDFLLKLCMRVPSKRMCATCPAHILLHDLITLIIIFGEENK